MQTNQFVAELTSGTSWKSDQEAVKAAGFKTSGPPDWRWTTSKASPLNKLRDKKPDSGLVLTEVALNHYKEINQKEEQKAALKKQFDQAHKQAKKESLDTDISGLVEFVPAGVCAFGCVCSTAADLKPFVPMTTLPKFPVPETACMICGDGLYYPLDYPDVCYVCRGR